MKQLQQHTVKHSTHTRQAGKGLQQKATDVRQFAACDRQHLKDMFSRCYGNDSNLFHN